MVNHVQLNNVDHANLRIITKRSKSFGDDVMHCMTFPFEFRSLQAHYPIFFLKDPKTAQFQAVALLGFEKGENLFLSETGWDARYIPMTAEMRPFLIGFSGAGGSQQHPEVHLDLDHPRVNRDEGERIFLEQGGRTDYLKKVAAILDAVHQGHNSNADFSQTLQEFDLLEPFSLDVELNDGSLNRLAGFYTIHEQNLYALDGKALATLNEKHYLQPLFMAVASLSNIRALIERKNAALPGAGAI